MATVRLPEVGARYRAGTLIAFEGRGKDSEDGELPASAFTWRVDIHQGDRVISFVPPISGMALGTFTVPAEAETGASGWLRIHLKVRDRDGNTHAIFRDVHPQERTPSGRRSFSFR
ncbi:MAG: hypothetical protein JXB05_07230 [Myxococcaceae bacterium]|nr:hypothetical protein [Myxococcaceae bacterium]